MRSQAVSDHWLSAPLRGAALPWLCGLSLGALPIQLLFGALDVQWFPSFAVGGSPALFFLFVLGVGLDAAWWLVALKLAVEGLLGAAADGPSRPAQETFATDAQASRNLLLLAGATLGLYLLLQQGHGGMALVFGLGLAAFLPAALMVATLGDSLFGGLDPRVWFELCRRLGMGYARLVLSLLVLASFGLVVAWLASKVPRLVGATLLHATALYLVLAAYAAMGQMLHAQGEQVEAGEPRLPLSPPATVEEDIALRDARGILAADGPNAAAARLRILITGQGASAPIHQRYRELLALAGNQAGLLDHARGHVAVLLALGQEREALALYLASLGMEPTFGLDEPERVAQLIDLAVRRGLPQLAVSLASEFARRFPRERDLVLIGLMHAGELRRLGRPDEAQALLIDLRTRFPDHALSAQLEAALQPVSPD